MAKQQTTQRSRLFEISFEKVETVTVSRRREALVVSKEHEKSTDEASIQTSAIEVMASEADAGLNGSKPNSSEV
ncbi:MAG: hypothetical protein KF881_12100 [Acidobacteria bacterium]|nr:hypothetical protein [Acidobacteriota bacterium]